MNLVKLSSCFYIFTQRMTPECAGDTSNAVLIAYRFTAANNV